MHLSDIRQVPVFVVKDYYLTCDIPGNYVPVVIPISITSILPFFHNRAFIVPVLFDIKNPTNNSWTHKSGYHCGFILPKEIIEVVPIQGFSHPTMRIGKHDFQVLCSGGGTPGRWVDYLHHELTLPINPARTVIKAIHEAAVNPESVVAYRHHVRRLSPPDLQEWQAHFIRQKMNLRRGMLFHLHPPHALPSTEGPFSGPFQVEEKRSKTLAFTFQGKDRTSSIEKVDWFKTAEANQFSIPQPELRNKVGDILPSLKEEQESFLEANRGRLISVAAWGADPARKIPPGFVGVKATINGNKDGVPKYFLVPSKEYNDAFFKTLLGVVIDPSRHQVWQKPEDVQ
jgi:hypothetical protein